MGGKPEHRAREQIDAMLTAAGWAVQDYHRFDPTAAPGVALREVPLKSGRCDYLLLVGRTPVGVVEAKKEGTTCAFTYRLIKYAGVRRVLFLVDRANLGRQALTEF